MARTFSTGVEVPTSGDRHPSEAWWARMGATVNEAILRKTQEAIAAVARDYVPRSEATQYGIPGPASKISIGTVQGGATAAASMTGDAPAQTLSLTLPQGPRGPEGPGGAFQMVETADPGLFETSQQFSWRWDTAGQGRQLLFRDSAVERMVYGDTGIIDIRATFQNVAAGGSATLRRISSVVVLNLYDIKPATDGTVHLVTVPMGYRPQERTADITSVGASTFREVILFAPGAIQVANMVTSDRIRKCLTWVTNDPWPSK